VVTRRRALNRSDCELSVVVVFGNMRGEERSSHSRARTRKASTISTTVIVENGSHDRSWARTSSVAGAVSLRRPRPDATPPTGPELAAAVAAHRSR
jgi:hypothetical protein